MRIHDQSGGKTTMPHEVKELLGELRIREVTPSAARHACPEREAGISPTTPQGLFARYRIATITGNDFGTKRT